MNEKALKNLSRAELLELLIVQSKRVGQLEQQVKELEESLAARELQIKESGTMAEAALRLSGIFEAADAACAQYTENMRLRQQKHEALCKRLEQESIDRARQMLKEAKHRCDAMEKTAGGDGL